MTCEENRQRGAPADLDFECLCLDCAVVAERKRRGLPPHRTLEILKAFPTRDAISAAELLHEVQHIYGDGEMDSADSANW